VKIDRKERKSRINSLVRIADEMTPPLRAEVLPFKPYRTENFLHSLN